MGFVYVVFSMHFFFIANNSHKKISKYVHKKYFPRILAPKNIHITGFISLIHVIVEDQTPNTTKRLSHQNNNIETITKFFDSSYYRCFCANAQYIRTVLQTHQETMVRQHIHLTFMRQKGIVILSHTYSHDGIVHFYGWVPLERYTQRDTTTRPHCVKTVNVRIGQSICVFLCIVELRKEALTHSKTACVLQLYY